MVEIAFIGGGVMGSALAGAAVRGIGPQQVMITDIDEQKLAAATHRLGCLGTTDNAEAVRAARFVVFCIKPHLLYDVLRQVSPAFAEARRQGREQVVVTIVPSVTAQTYREVLDIPDLPVIRLVPNTACTVGKGLSLIMADSTYTEAQALRLQEILGPSGSFDILPPAQYVQGAVVASTAPAFLGMFAAAMEDAGVYIGLPRDKARRYILECMVSTGQMLLENGRPSESVKEDVCSPAGAAIRGVRALEAGGMRSAIIEAIIKCHEQYGMLGDIQK